jgi:hypothetical protein
VSREELLTFEKFQQLEAEGVFADERNQYLLSAICRLGILYLASKGGKADELTMGLGYPSVVQMRVPNEEDLQRIEEKKMENDKQFGRSLLAIAQSKGIEVRKISKQQFFKEFCEDVQ